MLPNMNVVVDSISASPLAQTALRRLAYMFYIINPKEASYESPEQVPNYVNQVIPCFFCFIMIEKMVNILTDEGERHSLADDITSVSQGVFSETTKLYQKGIGLGVYIWVYENYRISTLPWNSVWTWLVAFLLTDLIYYVVHRLGHEVNIFWAAHQVHHSSEYYNFTTALRQSIIHNIISFYFYLPMALCVPPSAYLVHQYFNLIYQFWIHTEVVKSIGPLEYILNTPSHHRVHHGRNRYCIDKNYAAVLIIWDRMFGTFQAEREEDKVVYGLVHPVNTFSPLEVQLYPYVFLFQRLWSTKGSLNKIKRVLYGPGWEPGKPRSGLITDIPDIKAPCDRYNPSIPLWCKIYTFLHFTLFSCGYLMLALNSFDFAGMKVHVVVVFVIFSMTSIGAILDGRPYAAVLELVRCVLYFSVDLYLFGNGMELDPTLKMLLFGIRVYFVVSTVIWSVLAILSFSIRIKVKSS